MKFFAFIFCLFICINAQSQIGIYEIPLDDTVTYGWTNWIVIDTVSYQHNQWEVGRPHKKLFSAPYDYPNVLVTDTVLPCKPNDTSAFILTISPSALFGFAWVTLKYRLDIDSADTARIEYSIDSGGSWTDIAKDSMALYVGPSSFTSTPGNEWDSIKMAPSIYRVSLNSLWIRFTLITGADTTPRDGWMIDDIEKVFGYDHVVAIPASNIIELFPNPTYHIAQIRWAQPLSCDCEIRVIDALGRQVFKEKLVKSSKEYSLDVQRWAKGAYFVEIDDGKGNRMEKKLVVE